MATAAKASKKPRKTRKVYPPKKRAAILAEALTKGLTGKEVAAKYGISMVTYYNWRKKEGTSTKLGRHARAKSSPSGNGSTGEMRSIIKERVRSLAPSILRDEVMAFLAESIGARAKRRAKHR